MSHANQCLVYRHNLITTISDEVWDKLEDPDTQKRLRQWVPPSHNTPGSSVFIKVDGLLARADWEDLKEMLSPIAAVGWYNRILTWPSAQSAGGLFLLNDDVSSRDLPGVLTTVV